MPDRKTFEFTADARNAKVKLYGAPVIGYETVNIYLIFTLENEKLCFASSSPRLPRARVFVNEQSVVTPYEEKSENAESMHPGVEPQDFWLKC